MRNQLYFVQLRLFQLGCKCVFLGWLFSDLPSTKIVTYIVKFGERAVKVKVGESLVATTLATLLGAASKGLVDIKAGDIITVDGKGNIIQTRPNTTSNGSGGSGGSSGSISIIGAGGGSVVIGCTGSGG